jgi:GNAT superfamily N-acetyltransferase
MNSVYKKRDKWVEPIKNCNDQKLITSIIYNLYNQKLQYSLTPYCESITNDHYKSIISKVPFSKGNQVYLAQLDTQNVNEVISHIINTYNKRRMPFSWYVGPLSEPKNLGDCLLNHGLKFSESYPCMACDLKNVNEDFSYPMKLEIKLVQKEESMREWSKTVLLGFNGKAAPDEIDLTYKIESSIGYKEDTGRFRYLAYLNGEAIGTSMLTLNSGVAGIHGVSTIPHERGKGIGTLMSLFTLKEAKRKGYFVGILRASRMGINVYKKIGFQEYCHVDVYNWDSLSTS